MQTAFEQHFTIDQVADLLSIHRTTVKRKIDEGVTTRGRRGIFPVFRLGTRSIRIPASAVHRYRERFRV